MQTISNVGTDPMVAGINSISVSQLNSAQNKIPIYLPSQIKPGFKILKDHSIKDLAQQSKVAISRTQLNSNMSSPMTRNSNIPQSVITNAKMGSIDSRNFKMNKNYQFKSQINLLSRNETINGYKPIAEYSNMDSQSQQDSSTVVRNQKYHQDKQLREESMYRHKQIEIQEKKTRDLLKKLTQKQVTKKKYNGDESGTIDNYNSKNDDNIKSIENDIMISHEQSIDEEQQTTSNIYSDSILKQKQQQEYEQSPQRTLKNAKLIQSQSERSITGISQYLVQNQKVLPSDKSRNNHYFNTKEPNTAMDSNKSTSLKPKRNNKYIIKEMNNLDDNDELIMRLKLFGKVGGDSSRKIDAKDAEEFQQLQQDEDYIDELAKQFEQMTDQKSQKYFKDHIKDKIADQYNQMPVSLVALSQNRKYILEQLFNRKNLFPPQRRSLELAKLQSKDEQQEGGIKVSESQRNLHLPQIQNRNSQSSAQRSRFLQDLRNLSIGKFKEGFLKQEDDQRKNTEVKKYKSRGQFENVANFYRFLPQERQKKIEKQINRLLDEKQRMSEMDQYLEFYIRDGDKIDEEAEQQMDRTQAIINAPIL
ncbi:UNKNOWN [Stylonychia lemnae]|uniref:Uncharacterized protein n=1 Tax=Stylonychia lemnae TaxID=5949 RepID=A0A078A848_STYLE|nr:UNKNOWN [Stylonychia lemnae]|eukprot:CDW76951.1 UNKNOWN [Stylonychia lemnae]